MCSPNSFTFFWKSTSEKRTDHARKCKVRNEACQKLDIKLRLLIISTETIKLSFLNSQHLIMFEEIFHELGMIPSEINDSLK